MAAAGWVKLSVSLEKATGHSALTGPRPPGASFEGENIFLEKNICHVPFVSFGSLGGFILFNEPALLAGFLKLFSKP